MSLNVTYKRHCDLYFFLSFFFVWKIAWGVLLIFDRQTGIQFVSILSPHRTPASAFKGTRKHVSVSVKPAKWYTALLHNGKSEFLLILIPSLVVVTPASHGQVNSQICCSSNYCIFLKCPFSTAKILELTVFHKKYMRKCYEKLIT